MHGIELNLVHTNNFYNNNTINGILCGINELPFVESNYGKEIQNFNLINPNFDKIFSNVLNEPIIIDENSGKFRKPFSTIHFESFENLKEWCFAVALEKTIFTSYKHLSGAQTALDGYKFNYKNLFEWDYICNIQLEPGQGIFFRPWTFHSFSENKIIQQFKLYSNKTEIDKKIILVMGLPGSGKTTLSKKLSKLLNASYINADVIREMYNDWDFSLEGRDRQAKRMKKLALLSNSKYTIVDFICPKNSTRDYLTPDFIIWMDTIQQGRFEDTNAMFEKPSIVNIHIINFNNNIDEIVKTIKTIL